MAKAKVFLGTAAACLAALVLGGAAPAQQEGGSSKASASEVETRERNTNEALLKGLLKRRGEIIQAPASAEGKRHALEFLDRQIAMTRARLGR